MATRTIAVVSAGLNRPSSTSLLADRLADATGVALGRLDVDSERVVVELREHAHDLTDNLLTSFASEALDDAKAAVADADGVIAVTPVFSASYNGLFKTFFDVLDEGVLRDKPVLLGATGGTARHSLAIDHALRPLFAYLGALVTPTAVFAATEDWGNDSTVEPGLVSRIERAGTELAHLVARGAGGPGRDAAPVPAPFVELLHRS